MRIRIEINAENATLEEVKLAMQCGLTRDAYRRLQSIELLLKGYERDEVRDILSVTDRSMQRWISKFNERGIDGIIERGEAGRPRKIERERFEEEIVPLILHPEECEEVHWTAVKFHGYLVNDLAYELSYRTLLRYFHEQDIKLLMPRRWPEKQDPEKRQAYIEAMRGILSNSCNKVWFGDESGIEGDPRPRLEVGKERLSF